MNVHAAALRPKEPDAEQVWQESADRLLVQCRTKLALARR